MEPCDRCGIDLTRIMQARRALEDTVHYLGLRPEGRLIEPTISFESGALEALNWALGFDQDGLFGKHVEILKQLVATRKAQENGRTSCQPGL